MLVVHVLRKPLVGSVAENVLAHGCGAMNIDETRIAHSSPADLAAHQMMVTAIKARGGQMDNSWKNSSDLVGANDVNTGGRWPANLVLEHLPGCRCLGTRKVEAITGGASREAPNQVYGKWGRFYPSNHADANGLETVDAWECEPGCPVAALDGQTSNLLPQGAPKQKNTGESAWFGGGAANSSFYGDAGGASRFFKQVGGHGERD